VSLSSRTPLLLVATLVALPLRAQAQAPRAASPSPASRAVPPDAPLPFDTSVIRGALPNGIHYLVRRNVKPENRAELRLVVNAGSILENDRQLGVAHFVEHMAFNGTRRFPKASLVNFLERVGVKFGPDLNAYTSFDETVYMLRIPTDTAAIVNTALDILEDWATGLAFDTTEIRKERGVSSRSGAPAAARRCDCSTSSSPSFSAARSTPRGSPSARARISRPSPIPSPPPSIATGIAPTS